MITLTLEARLNIAMGTLAKPAQTNPTIEYQNNTKHTVTICGKPISGQFTAKLGKVISEDCIKEYYRKKFSDTYDNALWEVLKNAIAGYNKFPKGLNKMIHKYHTNATVQI
jgi:hypothetical protein